jgi:hypothetical protein
MLGLAASAPKAEKVGEAFGASTVSMPACREAAGALCPPRS